MTGRAGEDNGTINPDAVTMNKPVLTQVMDVEDIHNKMAQPVINTKRVNVTQNAMPSPSDPFGRNQSSTFQDTSPSASQPTRENSPRSLNQDSSHTPPLPRRLHRGCRFEAGMAKARRRVPYSLGPEKLETESEALQLKLGKQEESKITANMQELYSRLVPTEESEQRRTMFVQKLENLLRLRWPGHHMNVSVFGSTGNRLGTSDSDVDICITTDCKELEHVCSIAELLDKHGMERIVCVSSAKVPIVKAWDPELQVACDINVNNPIALENTQMIRSYTVIDERFRPLAMIIKYWAKRRILNDAALGGTLSSYTWICMVLNFLQTLDPPILPSLQQKPGLASKRLNGIDVAFDRDLDAYRDFGARNTSSLGELLFQFFRYFGHDVDFENNAFSVRLGKVVPKSQKKWHLLQDNRLCVEEPFNTSRNLANTADDTTMRGIHLELRRAFRSVAEGDFEKCCEQYEAGPEERRHTEAFIHPIARTIIPQAPTQPAAQTHRSNRNSFRGGRHSNRNSNRRASNPSGRNPTYLHDLPFQMTPQELQLQAQHQQHLLHDQLFQQYQYLQLQEQELRMQLYQQSLRQRGVASGQPLSQGGFNGANNLESSATMPSSAGIRMPLSPNMFQSRYNPTSPFLRNSTPVSGVMTNPASPLLSNAVPDSRRYTRRTSMTSSSPAGSLRAQSQPARSFPFIVGSSQPRQSTDQNQDYPEPMPDRRASAALQPQMFASVYSSQPQNLPGALYEAGRRPAEYMGYYVGQSPSLPASSRSTAISPFPSHAGLAIHNGGLSPKLSSRSSRLPSITSSPSLRSTTLEDASELAASAELGSEYHAAREHPESPKARTGPLIVDGSVYSPQRRRPTTRVSLAKNDIFPISASTSDDLGVDTPSSSDDQYPDYRRHVQADHKNSNGVNQLTDELSENLSSLAIGAQAHLVAAANGQNACESHEESPNPHQTDSNGDISTSEPRTNGSKNRKKKPKAEKPPNMMAEVSGVATYPLLSKTNGQDANSGSPVLVKNADSLSGWQTQKKRRTKKTTKSESDATLLNSAGGEVLPLDESLRKGG